MKNDTLTTCNPADTKLKTFIYENCKVRTFLDESGEPWFIASDVAKLLGYKVARDATRILDQDEKGEQTVLTPGGPQKLGVINESGLYSLILLSRKPEIKKFKKWITAEVLPSIRKTGSYGNKVDLNDPKQLRILLLNYSDKIERDQSKVQFYDKYINSDGFYNLQNAARALNQSPNLFINNLKNTYLFYQGSALVPYQLYRKQGLFIVKSTLVDNIARYQTYITPKGLEYFSKKSIDNQKFLYINEDRESKYAGI
jgi:anti-repressor protein